MRKVSLFLLLATAAAPAMAAVDRDSDRAERRAARAEASEQSDSRPQRAARAAASEQSDSRPQRAARAAASEQSDSRPQRAARAAASEQSDSRPQRSERAQSPSSEQGGAARVRERRDRDGGDRPALAIQVQDSEPVREPRPAERRGEREATTATQEGSSGGLRPRERRIRTIPDSQPTARAPTTMQPPASVTRHRRDYRDGKYNRWTRNWHRDNRYDWRRHRDRHRSIFRLGFYYDPFGWSYRRWNIGWHMWPSHYSSRYWLNDPWQYRLPPAYGPYRWVRYWDDALLVNIYTGEVVDVIHNFFW